MSVYQILYMERVPDSAVCNEAVKLARNEIPGSFRICEWCPADGLQRKRETCLEGRFGALFDPPVDVIHVGGNVWKRDF